MTQLEVVQAVLNGESWLELNKEKMKNQLLIEALKQLYGAVWEHLETAQEERELDLERRKAECQ